MKVSKVTVDSVSRHATTTLYLHGFVYQRMDTITNFASGYDTLQFYPHEDGRARMVRHVYQNGTTQYKWEYDFFEKDHLGNTRMVLTLQKDTGIYAATMEGAFRAKENALFYNIPQTAYSRTTAGYPVDTTMTNPNDSVIMLNGMAGRTQGPAIILKVMAGDSIALGVKSFYTSQTGTGTNPSITDVLTSLAGGVVGLTGGAKGSVGDLNTTTSPLYGALNSFITNKETTVAGKPRAYLNWILLDDQYQYDQVKSGAIPVSNFAAGVQGTLAKPDLVAAKNGFLYVWVSNETQGWPVFFDNLSVSMYAGRIVEETHYYPFGLTMAGISDKALKTQYAENKYKFNEGSELQNKEFSDGSGLEMYDPGFRSYDPQIGRFWQADPLAELFKNWSPYSYAFDNPVALNDPLGLAPDSASSSQVVPAGSMRSQVQGIVNVNPNASTPDPAAAAGPAPTSVPDPISSTNNSTVSDNPVTNANDASNVSTSGSILSSNCHSFSFYPKGPDGNLQVAAVTGVYFNWYYHGTNEKGNLEVGLAGHTFSLLFFEFPRIRAGKKEIITPGMAATTIAKIIDEVNNQLDYSNLASIVPTQSNTWERESYIYKTLQIAVREFGGRVSKVSNYGLVPITKFYKSLAPSFCW